MEVTLRHLQGVAIGASEVARTVALILVGVRMTRAVHQILAAGAGAISEFGYPHFCLILYRLPQECII